MTCLHEEKAKISHAARATKQCSLNLASFAVDKFFVKSQIEATLKLFKDIRETSRF